jgi:hypothetical protein
MGLSAGYPSKLSIYQISADFVDKIGCAEVHYPFAYSSLLQCIDTQCIELFAGHPKALNQFSWSEMTISEESDDVPQRV